MIFLYLFYTFCKIGLFGFGGGYAMLSMIQGEVVTRYNWVSASEFTDIIAISQMTPGPIGINSATSIIHINGNHQPVLLEIPKASGCRSRIQRVTSGSGRSAGSGCTRLDEC